MPVGAFLSFPACLFRDGRPPSVDYKFLQSGCPPDIGEYLGLYGGIPTAGRQECHCAGEHELQELLGISPVDPEAESIVGKIPGDGESVFNCAHRPGSLGSLPFLGRLDRE